MDRGARGRFRSYLFGSAGGSVVMLFELSKRSLHLIRQHLRNSRPGSVKEDVASRGGDGVTPAKRATPQKQTCKARARAVACLSNASTRSCTAWLMLGKLDCKPPKTAAVRVSVFTAGSDRHNTRLRRNSELAAAHQQCGLLEFGRQREKDLPCLPLRTAVWFGVRAGAPCTGTRAWLAIAQQLREGMQRARRGVAHYSRGVHIDLQALVRVAHGVTDLRRARWRGSAYQKNKQ